MTLRRRTKAALERSDALHRRVQELLYPRTRRNVIAELRRPPVGEGRQ